MTIEKIIKKTDSFTESQVYKESLQKLEEANAVTNFLGNAFQFIFNRNGRSWSEISRDRANAAIEKAKKMQQKQMADFKLIADTAAVLDKMPSNIGTLAGSKVGPGTKNLEANQVIEAFGNLFDDNGIGGVKAAQTAGLITAAAAATIGIGMLTGGIGFAPAITGAAAKVGITAGALNTGFAAAAGGAATAAAAQTTKAGLGVGTGSGYIGKIANMAKTQPQMAGLYNSYVPQLKQVRKAFHSYCTKKGNPLSMATGLLATNKLVYNQKYKALGFSAFMQAIVTGKDPSIDMSGQGDATSIINKLQAALNAGQITKQDIGAYLQKIGQGAQQNG